MATKVSTVDAESLSILPRGTIMLNAIRADASAMYQALIPEAIDSNISAIGNVILTKENVRNEFLSGLINKIGLTYITGRTYSNPLAPFKRGRLDIGETIEEIFINLIPETAYDVEIAEEQVDRRAIPDVRSVFHTVNRKGKFKWTVQWADLESAFYSTSTFESFVARLMERAYTSDELNEFIYMKDIFRRAAMRGHIHAVPIVDVTDEATAKTFMVQLRAISSRLTFMSTQYTATSVFSHSPKSDQYIFVLPELEAFVGVNVLASAFNREDANYPSRVIVVDDFGGLEKQGVKAILCDTEFFNVWDRQLVTTSRPNEEGLFNNHWLHHWQILSYSPFVNAVLLTTDVGNITNFTISPTTETVSNVRLSEVRFTAEFDGAGIFSQAVLWEIYRTDGTPTSAIITTEGKVVIPRGEPIGTLEVKATSQQDTSFTDVATITVS